MVFGMRRYVDLGAVVHRHLNEVLKNGELNLDGVRIRVVKRDGKDIIVIAEGFVKFEDDEIVKMQTYVLRIW
jgi:exoribonuclease R